MRYVTEAGEVADEIFDAVVLSVGMVIPPDVVALAEKLEVPLSPNNFVEASCFEPTTTFREGIFSCGAFNGPKDIPQSVMEGQRRRGRQPPGSWPRPGAPWPGRRNSRRNRTCWKSRPGWGSLCATAA